MKMILNSVLIKYVHFKYFTKNEYVFKSIEIRMYKDMINYVLT